ncbi:MAG TPA: hypothetical protein VFF78_07550 [Anaerolineaceae bacterium]|nr:hypothetical protein [Anaerolineaceae bacterium]
MLKRTPPPNALSPSEVRFLDLHTEPWPDGKRIKVFIHLTPFQEFPNLEVTIFNSQAEEVAHTSIIENAEEKLVFTMHIRDRNAGETLEAPQYLLQASLGYPDLPDVDRAETRFTLIG